jgi:antitoxin YefM
MKTLPFVEARAKLSHLVDRVEAMDEEVVITRRGRPVAVLVSSDEYEGWKDTRAIRTDREFMAEIRRGLRALKKKGRIYTLEELIPGD